MEIFITTLCLVVVYAFLQKDDMTQFLPKLIKFLLILLLILAYFNKPFVTWYSIALHFIHHLCCAIFLHHVHVMITHLLQLTGKSICIVLKLDLMKYMFNLC